MVFWWPLNEQKISKELHFLLMKLHCAFSNNYIYGYNCIVYIVQHYQERHILSELGVFMVCPHLWFALTIYLPYIWFTLRIFLKKMESYENYNWWFALLPECPTSFLQLWFALIDGLPYMWFTLRILWPKLEVMKITIAAVPVMVCPHWWFTLHVVYPTQVLIVMNVTF